MSDLNALIVFARVVEANSFSEAARRLGMPVSTVSRKVADLENALGVRLLERSTRILRLTNIGSDVFQQAQRGVELSEAVDGIVSNKMAEVKGLLRLSIPPSIAESLLTPIVSAFQASYPGVRVHVMVTGRFVDHIAEGVDLVFRAGKLKDSSLVAKTILRYRHQLLANPEYLKGRRPPETPQDLLGHRLLAFSSWTPENSWTFSNGSAEETISFQPHLAMNDFTGLASALAVGAGIGDLPPFLARELLKNGRLVEVMREWRFRPIDFSMVHLGNRHISRPVRLFKELAFQMAPALFGDLPS